MLSITEGGGVEHGSQRFLIYHVKRKMVTMSDFDGKGERGFTLRSPPLARNDVALPSILVPGSPCQHCQAVMAVTRGTAPARCLAVHYSDTPLPRWWKSSTFVHVCLATIPWIKGRRSSLLPETLNRGDLLLSSPYQS